MVQILTVVGGTEPGNDLPKTGVVAVAQDQRIGHRVADGADADLERAAIGDQSRRVNAGGMIRQADRPFRYAEQREAFAVAQHVVELGRVDLRITAHPGHFVVHFGDEPERGPPVPARLEQRQGDIGIAAEIELSVVGFLFFSNELSDDIHIRIEDVTEHVGIVRGNMVLLCRRHAQPLAGRQEELTHLDVVRHVAAAHVGGVVQGHVFCEQPLGDRLDETAFQFAAPFRRVERQRGENGQRHRAVDARAPIDRIHQGIRLADAERQRQHDPPAGFPDDGLGQRIGVGPALRPARHQSPLSVQYESGAKRSP
jgi:hypothetical protein